MRYKAASLLLLAVGLGLIFASSVSTAPPASALQTITQVGVWKTAIPPGNQSATGLAGGAMPTSITGLAAGDLLVAYVGANNSALGSTFGPTLPGWHAGCGNAVNFRDSSGPWYHFVTADDIAGTETDTNTVFMSGTLNVSSIVSAWRGVDPTNPTQTVGGCASSTNFSSVTSVTAASVTPAVSGMRGLFCEVMNSAVTPSITTTSWSIGASLTGTTYGQACATASLGTSATAPQLTWTGSASGVASEILLRPAPDLVTTTTSTTTTTIATTTTTTIPPTTTTVCSFCGTKKNAVYLRQHDVESIRGDVLFGGAIVIALAAASLVTGLYRTSK